MPIRRGPTPKTGGLLTFIGAPTGTIEELTPGMFGVFGVPYDVSAPDQLGPRLAPKAYRETSTYFQMMTAQDGTLVEINSRLPPTPTSSATVSVIWVTSPSPTSIGRYCLPPFGTQQNASAARAPCP